MRRRRGAVETYTVASRGLTKGGTEKTRAHYFPIHSHPMFRAALQNENSVQNAIVGQSEFVDPEALDAALEKMVTELIEQQLNQHPGKGGTPLDPPKDNLVVTEGQLLAVLAEATGVTPLPQKIRKPSAKYQPMKAATVAKVAVADASMTSPLPLQPQHLRPSEYNTTTHSLYSNHNAERRIPSPPRTDAASTTGAAPLTSSDGPPELNVLSVNALRHAALRGGERDSGGTAVQLPALPSSADSATARHHPVKKIKLNSPWVSSSRQQRPTPSLYSLLPCLGISPGLTTSSASAAADSSARGAPPSPLSFRHMDRRPGVSVGPVALQAVDAQHLHEVPEAVFASMDILMDGNSCCMRRRHRLKVTNTNKEQSLALKPNQLPTSTSDTARSACFAFGCGQKGECLNRMFIAAGQNTLPALPPPRTAREAKARRILEKRRHKQWLNDQARQHHMLDSSATSGRETEEGNSTVVLPTEPLGWREKSQADLSQRYSTFAVPQTASTRPPSRRSSPLLTLRGVTSTCAYTQAVDSVNRIPGFRL